MEDVYKNGLRDTEAERFPKNNANAVLVRIVWEAAADAEREARESKIAEQAKLMKEMRARKEEMRKDGVKMVPGGSL